jgi:hypothetical protein
VKKLTGATLAPPDPPALVAISYSFTVPFPAAAKNRLSGEIDSRFTCCVRASGSKREVSSKARYYSN